MTDHLAEALRELVRAEVRAELAALRGAPVAPRLLSVPDSCAALGGISRAELYKQFARGLRVVHVGRRVFVPEAELRRFIEQQAPPGGPR